MRVAVINETSAADKNPHILGALSGRGFEVMNVGMCKRDTTPELTYIHTGLLAAVFLGTRSADVVVGGCGTGQGFLNSCMQYPGVFCGLIADNLDAWLFRQINGGNCISLPLNQGYGWAGEVNLRFIFDAFFSVASGEGYPESRRESQQASRRTLAAISRSTHRPMAEILQTLDADVVVPALSYPGVVESLDFSGPESAGIAESIRSRLDAEQGALR